MKKFKLLIVDSNESFVEEIRLGYVGDDNIEIVGTAKDGVDAVAKIESFCPDIVLLDIVLSELDGFGVMTSVDRSKAKPIFIVASQLVGDAFISKAIKAGASYYLVKPLKINLLKERIEEFCKIPSLSANVDSHVVDERLVQQAMKRSERSVDEKLANIFISLGIPAHIKGYQFLREAIKLAVNKPDIINSITKKLYPSIATSFETSASKVERAIRHAIEVAWNRGRIESINTLFGFKVYTANDKPTNGEFIALIADKLMLEGM